MDTIGVNVDTPMSAKVHVFLGTQLSNLSNGQDPLRYNCFTRKEEAQEGGIRGARKSEAGVLR